MAGMESPQFLSQEFVENGDRLVALVLGEDTAPDSFLVLLRVKTPSGDQPGPVADWIERELNKGDRAAKVLVICGEGGLIEGLLACQHRLRA